MAADDGIQTSVQGRNVDLVGDGVLERIRRSYGDLTDARAKVARFIVEHWDEAAVMSAAKLGEAVGVSESVAIRLAEELGYKGYPELQADIRETVKQRLKSVMVARLDMEDHASREGIADLVLQRDMDYIRRVFSRNDQEAIESACKLILKASTIYVLGLRVSHAPALFLYQNLSQLLGNARLLTPHVDTLFDQVRQIKPGDLLIAVTFHRYSRLTYQAIKMAKAWGGKVLTITDDVLGPPSTVSDHVLVVEPVMRTYGHSHTATMALLDAILETVVYLDKPRVRRSLAELEEVLEEFHPARNLEQSEAQEEGDGWRG
ncbi:MAG: MurR/RpiR family transcriptional regulator [Firmicutes bacterium]|nr:MurR/RpiR family transcriptional regulator [Candidatus Fermentithermobacillaceae bacterium]